MAPRTGEQIHSILNSGADPSSPELQEALAAAEIELKAELGGRALASPLDLNDSAMLRRFLVARKLQVPATVAMLEAHAAWLEQTYPIALPEVPIQPQPTTRTLALAPTPSTLSAPDPCPAHRRLRLARL